MGLFSTSSPFKFVSNIFYLRNSWSCDFLSADQILTCFWNISDSGFLLLLLTVMSWRHTIDNVVSLHDLLNGSCSVSREEQWQQLSRRRPVSRRGRRWPRQRALAASATTCQGGRTWQAFGRGKNGHETFRQTRIYNFRDKCVVFARNLKFSNLTQ